MAIQPPPTIRPLAESEERRDLREYMLTERQTLIMRLRRVDTILIGMGAIAEPTIKTHQERRAERHDRMRGSSTKE